MSFTPLQALFAGRAWQACTGLGCLWSPQGVLCCVGAASVGQEVGRREAAHRIPAGRSPASLTLTAGRQLTQNLASLTLSWQSCVITVGCVHTERPCHTLPVRNKNCSKTPDMPNQSKQRRSVKP